MPVAFQDPKPGPRHPRGQVHCLLRRGDEAVLIRRDEQRRHTNVSEPAADVVLCQDAEA